jgi:hypothetical protein
MNSRNENSELVQKIPDEKDIGEILSRFHPIPSQHFHERMTLAPWYKRPKRKRQVSFWQPFVAIVLVLTLFLITPKIRPTLNVVAHKLFEFFTLDRTDTNTIEGIINGSEGPFIINPKKDFEQSIEQVKGLVQYEIFIPTSLPTDYSLLGANYTIQNQQTSIYYEGDGRSMLFIQQPVGTYYEKIGASAIVEHVFINDILGEYVEGGWVLKQPSQAPSTLEPGTKISAEIYWEPDASRQTVLWQSNGTQYELISWGNLDKEQFILIAASLQQYH